MLELVLERRIALSRHGELVHRSFNPPNLNLVSWSLRPIRLSSPKAELTITAQEPEHENRNTK
jgi:hypothetical protein